jgi:hypothetical protein
MMARLRAWLLPALLASACGPDYAGLEIEIEADLSGGGVVTDDGIELALGSAVTIRARPRSRNHAAFDEPNEAELRSSHDGVMRVYATEESWRWILTARDEGQACLEVVLDGIVEDCIETRVVGQE